MPRLFAGELAEKRRETRRVAISGDTPYLRGCAVKTCERADDPSSQQRVRDQAAHVRRAARSALASDQEARAERLGLADLVRDRAVSGIPADDAGARPR